MSNQDKASMNLTAACAALQQAPNFNPKWCEIPAKLSTSTGWLKDASQRMPALNARIAEVQQQLTATRGKTVVAKTRAPQVVQSLTAAVGVAQRVPSETNIRAALAALETAQGLSTQIQALQRQEAAYNDMLTALAEQTELTVGASEELLAAAQLPEAVEEF